MELADAHKQERGEGEEEALSKFPSSGTNRCGGLTDSSPPLVYYHHQSTDHLMDLSQ